jgi:hypothetical protein
VAGWLQNVSGVRALAVVVIASGCFYTEPINERPSFAISQLTGTQVFRGAHVNLTAEGDDPDGDSVDLTWSAYACSDATAEPDGSRPGCDRDPRFTGTSGVFAFDVPAFRSDGATPVGSMFVTLDAVDEHAAAARPQQQLIIPVSDAPPTVMLALQPRADYVQNIPVQIFAKVGDFDDGASRLSVTWTAFSPTGSQTLSTESSTAVGSDLQLATTLVPDALGQWTIQVAATDPSNVTTMQSIPLDVAADQPPCLTTWEPAAPPAGETLPIDAPTLFQVLLVDDDLDPYPAMPRDPLLGTTTFAWSLLPPGATTRQPLSSSASVGLDPASYQPGDIVELRVEIFDRAHTTPLQCADSDPTCSIGANSCIQRLTWRVEIQ